MTGKRDKETVRMELEWGLSARLTVQKAPAYREAGYPNGVSRVF